MKTRDELVQQIHDEHAQWHALLAEVGELRMEEPGPMGDWTFKDLAAHLLAWRERTLTQIGAGPGEKPAPPWPASMGAEDEITDWDEVNAWFHQQHRDRPLLDVLVDVDRSYERFATLIESMPDEDLLTPGRWAPAFEGMEDKALVEGEFFGHFDEEHEPSLRAWLQSR